MKNQVTGYEVKINAENKHTGEVIYNFDDMVSKGWTNKNNKVLPSEITLSGYKVIYSLYVINNGEASIVTDTDSLSQALSIYKDINGISNDNHDIAEIPIFNTLELPSYGLPKFKYSMRKQSSKQVIDMYLSAIVDADAMQSLLNGSEYNNCIVHKYSTSTNDWVKVKEIKSNESECNAIYAMCIWEHILTDSKLNNWIDETGTVESRNDAKSIAEYITANLNDIGEKCSNHLFDSYWNDPVDWEVIPTIVDFLYSNYDDHQLTEIDLPDDIKSIDYLNIDIANYLSRQLEMRRQIAITYSLPANAIDSRSKEITNVSTTSNTTRRAAVQQLLHNLPDCRIISIICSETEINQI